MALFFDEVHTEGYVKFLYFSDLKNGLPSFMISNLKNKKINYPVKLLDERIIEIEEYE